MSGLQQRRFGFEVERDWELEQSDRWRVTLPHQCDAWGIAGDSYSWVPHADAVALMEQFITEAKAALEALRERWPA